MAGFGILLVEMFAPKKENFTLSRRPLRMDLFVGKNCLQGGPRKTSSKYGPITPFVKNHKKSLGKWCVAYGDVSWGMTMPSLYTQEN